MPQWIVSLVVNFVLRQIAKYAETTDWAKIKADAVARVAKLVPAWLVPSLDDVVGGIVDVLAAALADSEDLKKVVSMLIAGDVAGAAAALADLVAKVLHPHAGAVAAVLK